MSPYPPVDARHVKIVDDGTMTDLTIARRSATWYSASGFYAGIASEWVDIMCKLALLGLWSAGGMLLLAGNEIPPTFQVRLDDPLTSYGSPAGTAFTATAISPLEVERPVHHPSREPDPTAQ